MDELILRLVNNQLLSLSLNKIGRKSRSRRADVAAAAIAGQQLLPGQMPLNLPALPNANPNFPPVHPTYMYMMPPQQQQPGRAQADQQLAMRPLDDDDPDNQPVDSSMQPHSSSDSQVQTVDITGRRQTHAADVMLDAYATELEHGLGRSSLFTRLLLGFGASQHALIHLTLSHNGLDGASMAQLAGALQTNRSVRMLSVANNKIGSEGVKALCDCLRVNTAIQSLDLSNNAVMDEGGEYLAGLVHVTRTLTSLDLTNCSIYNTGTKSIIGALRDNRSLATLHLTKNYALVDGAALMGDVLIVNRTLTRLDLTANYIYAEGCKELCKGLQRNATLTELHLAGNEINNHGCKQLSKALAANNTLQILLIHDNLITHVGAKDLAAALRKNTSLTLLHLCDNQIGVKGAESIAKALKGNRVLQRLHLAANEISAQGIRHLAKALKTGAGGGLGGIERVSSANDSGAAVNGGGGSVVLGGGGGSSALIELNLSWNRFGSDGAKYIGVLLKDNATLKELSIAHNKMMDEGVQAIMENVRYNHCFPEHCTRVLTSHGFLFLDQIEWLQREGEEVLFGCYDVTSKQLQYSAGQLVYSTAPQHWLEFTSPDEDARWMENSGGCETESAGEDESTRSRHISLRVTPGHDMYVQVGERASDGGAVDWASTRMGSDTRAVKTGSVTVDPLTKMAAESLLSNDARTEVRMLACAETGYMPHSISQLQAVRRALDLNHTQFTAFIELFGFWLGSGTLIHAPSTDSGCVCFSQLNKTDLAWLRETIPKVGLEQSGWTSAKQGCTSTVYINNTAWFDFFDKEFGANSRHHRTASSTTARLVSRTSSITGSASTSVSALSSASASSRRNSLSIDSVCVEAEEAGEDGDENNDETPPSRNMHWGPDVPSDLIVSVKWLPDWVLTDLPATEMRLLIAGLRRANCSVVDGVGRSDNNEIHTCSARFRDQLMQALLHCGFSAYSELTQLENICITDYDGHSDEEPSHRAIEVDTWKVSWTDPGTATNTTSDVSCWPSMPRRQCIRKVDFDAERDGRTWCVSVTHTHRLIIAQRAQRDPLTSIVTKQSRPVITGNCLEVLDVSHNRVRQKGMEAIAASLQQNTALLSVNVEQSAGQQQQQQLGRFVMPEERGVYAKEETAIATVLRRNLQQHVVQQKQALLMAMHQRIGAGSVMQSVFRGSSIGDVSVLREVWEYCFGPKGDGSAGFQPFNPYSHMGNHDPRRPAHQ